MSFLSRLKRPNLRSRLLRYVLLAGFIMAGAGLITGAGLYFYLEPKLPNIEALKDVRLQVPLRVYSRDGKLIAEYGKMKRVPMRYEQLPQEMVHAILAAEDDRFFEHPGVDYQGIIRAAVSLVLTGERKQGGSTITMQVARNFFLSRERTYTRKLNEILLSLKIERELSKENILELYLNKIYLGKRSYGVAAAAQVYYGKELNELTLPQFAMIAGLPKAPSAYNPIANPERALQRRNYVLRRMHELEFITAEQYQEGLNAPVTAKEHGFDTEMDAPYLAEMVRAEMLSRYGEDAYTYGYNVYTTVDSRLQTAANKAMHNNLIAYEHRHGFRGPEKHVDLAEDAGSADWQKALEGMDSIGGLEPGLVIGLSENEAVVVLKDDSLHVIPWSGMEWARPYINDNALGAVPKKSSDILKRGDVVRVEQNEDGAWQLSQVPGVSGALISLEPSSGAVLALNGGFDFYHSKFNRVTQAERQPGSNFKPFIYSAALDNGFTPASIINDAPVVFEDNALESEWRPENYSGRFYGPTRLREALVHSRNLVSIRILQSIGINTAIDYVGKFGFKPEQLPHDLSLALGSVSLTPYQLVRGYATFANGGYLIKPYFIERIESSDGATLFEANPALACDEQCRRQREERQVMANRLASDLLGVPANTQPSEDRPVAAEQNSAEPNSENQPQDATPEPRFAERTVEPRNVYLIRSLMHDVIHRGTGRRALKLGRNDLCGKTGTTNDQRDAWFSGYNNDVVTTAWVGFDEPRSLGRYETGAHAALPMWIDYMREALKGIPEHRMAEPNGLVSVRIDAETGKYTSADNPDAIFELFRSENAPQTESASGADNGSDNSGTGSSITEGLF